MRLANFPFTLPHQLYSPELQVSWTLSPPPISALIPWLIYLLGVLLEMVCPSDIY